MYEEFQEFEKKPSPIEPKLEDIPKLCVEIRVEINKYNETEQQSSLQPQKEQSLEQPVQRQQQPKKEDEKKRSREEQVQQKANTEKAKTKPKTKERSQEEPVEQQQQRKKGSLVSKLIQMMALK